MFILQSINLFVTWGVTALIVLLPTAFLGALFPLAAAIHNAGRRGVGSAGQCPRCKLLAGSLPAAPEYG